jgi:hypothetical protein
METRSQARNKVKFSLYDVIIDFDAASEAWKKNKMSIGNGCYRYLCSFLDKNGHNCKNKCLRGKDVCSKHNKGNWGLQK